MRNTWGSGLEVSAGPLGKEEDLSRRRSTGRPKGYLPAAREILAREGGRGLLAGIGPTLVGIVPSAGETK